MFCFLREACLAEMAASPRRFAAATASTANSARAACRRCIASKSVYVQSRGPPRPGMVILPNGLCEGIGDLHPVDHLPSIQVLAEDRRASAGDRRSHDERIPERELAQHRPIDRLLDQIGRELHDFE